MKQNKYKEVVINVDYGGFSLSDLAYKELIKLGVPVRKYTQEKRDPKTGRYLTEPKNEGKIIFDRELTPRGEDDWNDGYWKEKRIRSKLIQRYWENWTQEDRENPLLVKVVKKLGRKANSFFSKLKVVKIPVDVEYTIEDHDGWEHIAEAHRTWE